VKKLLLLFTAFLVVLTACEQPATESFPPMPTSGLINGSVWSIVESKVSDSSNTYPALIYRMEGTDDKAYAFCVSKFPSGNYWFSVVASNSSPFNVNDYDKLLFLFEESLLVRESSPLGKVNQYPNSGSYYYDTQGLFSPEQFTSLTNEGDILVELSKANELKDSFVVSKNFQKLLKTFF